MFNRPSPFVVDQNGSYWFWSAVIPALVLAAIFRLSFSDAKVSAELKKAFAKLEPEVQVQFSGAKLSFNSGVLYPQIAIQIYDLNGTYVNSVETPEAIKFSVDEVKAPISLIELLSGRLGLSLLEVGNLQLSFDQPLVTHFTRKTSEAHRFNLIVTGLPTEKKTTVEPSFQIEAPRPVERVKIKSIRPDGRWGGSLGLEFRNVDLVLNRDGKAELSALIDFLFDKWGSQPSLPVVIRWNPEDKFITSAITSRWREGQVNIVLILDPAQDFYSLEGGLRSVPMSSFAPFLKKIFDSNQDWINQFIWPELIGSEASGWGSLDFGVTGYLVQKKPALFTLRNLLIEDGNQRIEVNRYSQTLGEHHSVREPLSVTLSHISFDRFAKLFGFEEFLDLSFSALHLSGTAELRGRSSYFGEDFNAESISYYSGEMSLELPQAKLRFKSGHDQKQIDILSSISYSQFHKVRKSENNETRISLTFNPKAKNWESKIFNIASGRFEGGAFENLKIDLLNSKIQVAQWKTDDNQSNEFDLNQDSISKQIDLSVIKTPKGFKGSWKKHKIKKNLTYHFEAEQDMSSPDTLQGKVFGESKQMVSDIIQFKFWPVLLLSK